MTPKLNFAMVCDKAFNEAAGPNGMGKLSIMGIFEVVFHENKFPLLLPQFSVIYNFSFSDENKHEIYVTITDQDGLILAKTGSSSLLQSQSSSSINFVANFNGIILKHVSNIFIKYTLDDEISEKPIVINLRELSK